MITSSKAIIFLQEDNGTSPVDGLLMAGNSAWPGPWLCFSQYASPGHCLAWTGTT